MIFVRQAQDERKRFAVRLATTASRLALAHAEASRRDDPARWRQAALLWPLFTQDDR